MPQQRTQRSALRRNLKWIIAAVFWIWLGGVLVAGATYAVGSAIGIVAAIFTPIALMLLLIAVMTFVRGGRRIRDLSVLYYLEHAVHLNVSLPAMLAAAEQGEAGAIRSRLRRLRHRLEQGDAVAYALSAATPGLSSRMTSLVAAGESTGQLAGCIRRIAVDHDFLPARSPTHSIFHRWYPLVGVPVFIFVVQLTLIFTFPKLHSSLRNFDLSSKWSDWISRNSNGLQAGFAIAGVLLLVMMLIFIGRTLSQVFTPQGLTLGPLRRPADVVVWFTPVSGGIVRSRALADACHVIADALGGGLPLTHAIATAATTSSNYVLATRLRRWASLLLAGRDIASTARVARLPVLLTSLLVDARSNDEIRSVFRFLGGYYDCRISRSAMFLRAALIPVLTLCVGAVTALLAYAFFEPLQLLIGKLAGQ